MSRFLSRHKKYYSLLVRNWFHSRLLRRDENGVHNKYYTIYNWTRILIHYLFWFRFLEYIVVFICIFWITNILTHILRIYCLKSLKKKIPLVFWLWKGKRSQKKKKRTTVTPFCIDNKVLSFYKWQRKTVISDCDIRTKYQILIPSLFNVCYFSVRQKDFQYLYIVDHPLKYLTECY